MDVNEVDQRTGLRGNTGVVQTLTDEQEHRLMDIHTRPPEGVNCKFVMDYHWDLWRMGLIDRADVTYQGRRIGSLVLTDDGLRALGYE